MRTPCSRDWKVPYWFALLTTVPTLRTFGVSFHAPYAGG